MDPLTQTLELLSPKALLWKQLDAAGDWIVEFPPANSVVFTLVEKGRCLFRSQAHGARDLEEGDFLLMTRPRSWSLANGETATASALDIQSGAGVRLARIGVDESEAETRLIGGGFRFSEVNEDLLEELLPPFVVIPASEPAAIRLRKVLALLADEVRSDRPGRNLAVNRLLELMLLESIRYHPNRPPQSRGGLLAGLADVRIAQALGALHTDVEHSWSVAELARLSGMSRSMFAERFSRVVGMPPIDYLLRWRMALAKEAQVAGRDRLATVARRCGYQSVSAFSAAFTRTVGCPPSRFLVGDVDTPSTRRLQNTAPKLPNGEVRQARA